MSIKESYRTPPQKILIIKQRGIGDIILSTPVFRSIRAHFRDAWITLLVDYPNAELFTEDPDIDEIVELRKSLFGVLRAINRIRGRYSIAFDLISTPFSLFLSMVSGAKLRIGWSKPKRMRGRLYTHPIDISRSIPSIDANLRALYPLDIQPVTRDVAVSLPEQERMDTKRRWWRQLSLDNKELTLAIHPGNLFETKQWFPERYANLAERLQERGYQVVITGSEDEAGTVRKVVDSARTDLVCLPPTSLREFTCFLSSVDLVIVNDGGVLHLAQAVGTKTFAIFASTDPFIWFPYDVPETGDYVYAGLDCSPCARKHCNSLKCLKDITVDEVFEKVLVVTKTIEEDRKCFT